MEGPLGAGSQSAADDGVDASFLSGTGRQRGVLQAVFGFAWFEAASGDEAAQGVGGAVEDVREAGAFGDLAAGVDRGEEAGEQAGGAVVAAGGRNGLPGPGRDQPRGGDVGGQVPGAFEFLGEPGRERGGLAGGADRGCRCRWERGCRGR